MQRKPVELSGLRLLLWGAILLLMIGVAALLRGYGEPGPEYKDAVLVTAGDVL